MMQRRRTYKSKSGAEYELVQIKTPTKAKQTKIAKASRPKQAKQRTTGEKVAGLTKTQYAKYRAAYERGHDMASALLIALKPNAKKSTKQKAKARNTSVKRSRKSTAKRKAPATKRKAKQQLSMF